ncbi:MAG: hypothetical protein EA426_08755 [Spirochaetaceae bacterium]|nr:MAG: hypothetical protein EA426_08755 [Spirochaetaceae bacterium]
MSGNSPISVTVVLKAGTDAGRAQGLPGRTFVGRVIAGGLIPTIEVTQSGGVSGMQGAANERLVDAAIRILGAGGLPVTDSLVSLLRTARRAGRFDERTLWLLGVFRDKGFGFEARDIEGLPGFVHGRDSHDSTDDRGRGDSDRRGRGKRDRRDELLRTTRAAIRRATDVPENFLQFFNHARGSGYHWIIVPFSLETDGGKIDATLTAALLPHRKKVAGARLAVTFSGNEYSFAWKPPPAGEMEVSVPTGVAPTSIGAGIDPDRAAAALKRFFGPRGFTRVSVCARDTDDGFSIPGVRGIIPRIDESV